MTKFPQIRIAVFDTSRLSTVHINPTDITYLHQKTIILNFVSDTGLEQGPIGHQFHVDLVGFRINSRIRSQIS